MRIRTSNKNDTKSDRPPMTPALNVRRLLALLLIPALLSAAHAQPSEAPALAASAAVPASAALPPAPKPLPTASLVGDQRWASLSPAQQAVLAPLADEWDGLDAARKSKWLEIAARFHTLTPEQQARLRERMIAWTRMSPAERQQARVGFQSNPQLRDEKLQSEKLQSKWEAYQALTPEERQALAQKGAEKAARKRADPKAAAQAQKPLSGAKSAFVPPRQAAAPVAVAPSVLQARPGVSTVLITQGVPHAGRQLPGRRKIVVDPALVDPKTLLPRAPQPSAAASAPAR
ncbi:DUF3106 domain-containing protein [Roseateles sp. DB2]|uniref:DUF3106 domain-containing protein n=1 Tax=Roseateles sp. DB2 TaxID=3453717 RepID=UPI003EECDB1B